MEAADLLVAITRCPVVERCQSGEQLGCSNIVACQPPAGGFFQVPEPWSGHLENAPILFVSSNPAIDPAEVYPTAKWDDADRVDFFQERFTSRQKPWLDARMRGLLTHSPGRSSRGTTFWFATRARASELLGRLSIPGVDYALTEVVHCKSSGQAGVGEAVASCVTRWLSPLMRLTAARIVVLMGKHAQDAFHDEYGVPVPMTFSEPRELEGRTRMVLQLPHPNARIPRAHCAPLSTEQLEMAQAYLRLA